MHDRDRTGSSLLDLLAEPTSKPAWDRFMQRYGPRVLDWCLRQGLQEADAEDTAHNVLCKMFSKLTEKYDRGKGSFRAWLRRVTENACIDTLRRQRRERGSGESSAALVLDRAVPSNVETLADEIEAELEKELFEAARARVQLRVEPRTWEAFQKVAVEGRTMREVAEEMKWNVTGVYRAQLQARKLVEEEVQRLQATSTGGK